MKYTFKANEVQCDRIGGGGFQAAFKSMDLIKEMAIQVREELSLDQIWKMILEADPDGDYYRGSRFNHVDDVSSRVATGLGNWAYNKFENEELTEMYIRNILETINKEDATTIVVDAHRACARTDHWYTFEKDWGI